jgi:hypothetical protein
MGLDMYVRSTPEVVPSAADFRYDHTKTEFVYYWRRHYSLNDRMAQLYRAKGGTAKVFNLVCLRLDQKDIDQLEVEIRQGRFPRREQMPTYYDAD